MKQINLLIAFHLSISRSLMSDSDPGKTLMLSIKESIEEILEGNKIG